MQNNRDISAHVSAGCVVAAIEMERSPIKDVEIKALLAAALTEKTDDRTVYMKGHDASYHYEGYQTFKTEELDKLQ